MKKRKGPCTESEALQSQPVREIKMSQQRDKKRSQWSGKTWRRGGILEAKWRRKEWPTGSNVEVGQGRWVLRLDLAIWMTAYPNKSFMNGVVGTEAWFKWVQEKIREEKLEMVNTITIETFKKCGTSRSNVGVRFRMKNIIACFVWWWKWSNKKGNIDAGKKCWRNALDSSGRDRVWYTKWMSWSWSLDS